MHHDRLGGEEGVMGRGGYEKEKEREKGRRGEQATTHISPVQHRTDRCYRLITRSIAIRGAARKLPKAEHPRRLAEESLVNVISTAGKLPSTDIREDSEWLRIICIRVLIYSGIW